jgi:hypothetical protein
VIDTSQIIEFERSCTLENVIEWAIRLASQPNQSNRRGRSNRRNTSVSQRSGSLTRAPNGSILPPSVPTRSASATPDLRPISCESTRPPPQNQRIPASTASTDNRKDRYHPRRKNQSKSKDKSPQPIEPRPKKKFTKLRQRIKNSIVIIRKKFTFQVSSPREPLESYDISRNTASASTSIRRDSILITNTE